MGIKGPDIPDVEILEVVEGESKYEKVEGVGGWEYLPGSHSGAGYMRANEELNVCEIKLEAEELDVDNKKWVIYLPIAGNVYAGLRRYWSISKEKGESDRHWKIRVMTFCDDMLINLFIEPAWQNYRDKGLSK